jgi:hypothetical protein
MKGWKGRGMGREGEKEVKGKGKEPCKIMAEGKGGGEDEHPKSKEICGIGRRRSSPRIRGGGFTAAADWR